jgi:hypothetical protein
MNLSRRDFLRLFGISVASVMLTRCKAILPTPTVTCYEPMPPTPVTPAAASVRERLRQCWFSFDDLATATNKSGTTDNTMGSQLRIDHRAALDELVARGELTAPVADLIQEAYEAALQHVWRSNIPVTCYIATMIDYTPASAQVLVNQSTALEQIATSGTLDPTTLETARAALEHDMAYYALTEQEVQALYGHLIEQMQNSGQPAPEFDSLPLDLTPDARVASQFILDLLTGK